jgi:hypothetical protein
VAIAQALSRPGFVLWLAGLHLRLLRNPGPEIAVLSVTIRAMTASRYRLTVTC